MAASLSDFAYIPLKLFEVNGIQIFKWDPQARMTRLEIARLCSLCLQKFLNLCFKSSYLIYGDMQNTLNATAYLLFTAFVSNSLMKGFMVVYGRRKVELLYRKMLLSFPTTATKRREYRVQDYYHKIQRYNKYLTIFHLVTTTAFNLFAGLQSLVEYCWLVVGGEHAKFEYRLPYMMVYPFDEKRPLTYIFAYTLQCCGAYSCSLYFLGSDLLLITSVHLINMHFEYLAKQIRAFKPRGTASDLQKLGKFLDYHSEILAYSEIIDDIFSVSILLNYMASSIVICLIGFQIVSGTEILDLLKFFLFLISTLVHVFYISLFGTEMITLSADVGDAFCEHRWYTADMRYRRMLPLPIARAQRPAHLTAFKFFDISMESFKTLMTTSYQFFTMIRTSLDEELQS